MKPLWALKPSQFPMEMEVTSNLADKALPSNFQPFMKSEKLQQRYTGCSKEMSTFSEANCLYDKVGIFLEHPVLIVHFWFSFDAPGHRLLSLVWNEQSGNTAVQGMIQLPGGQAYQIENVGGFGHILKNVA